MDLFNEERSFLLTIKCNLNGNFISYQLGIKTGIFSVDDNGFFLIVSDGEKYYFSFSKNYIPKGYNGVFHVNKNNAELNLEKYFENNILEILDYNFPVPSEIIKTWKRAFNFKEEVFDSEVNNIIEYGLRPPQIGALHSILSYWSLSSAPALVVMPTGTGKTETMISLIVSKICDKSLIIVPSDSLRDQLTNKFLSLGILKEEKFGIVEYFAKTPVVGTLKTSFTLPNEVEEFYSKCNIVIATTSIINQCKKNNINLFNEIVVNSSLLIVDEAHHCEATTWDKIISKFIVEKKKVLKFTATPFRNDKKRLKGKIIYNYPLSMAHKDGSFKKINFCPVVEFNPKKSDILIAEKAISQLKHDISNNYNHKLMVRVDNISRAEEVYEIYKEFKEFNPVLVHSRLGDAEKKQKLNLIKKDENCKIVVCVDMLGEGYDLPTLKICALHEIHKNITTSIQFFGRFTRSSHNLNLGNATIIANIGDKNLKDSLLKKLYAKDSDWNEILNISNVDILDNIFKEEDFFQKFRVEDHPMEKIPLRNISPALSTVVYKVNELTPEWNPDDYKIFFEKKNHQTIYAVHEEKNLLIIISKSNLSVRWGLIDDLINRIYDLHIVYFNEEQRLLFINSSNNSGLYEGLAQRVVGENIYIINESDIYKSLYEVEQLELFNLGVKPISDEPISYTQLFGRNVGDALDEITQTTKSSANLFGKGFYKGERITIGCSSKGRVWSRMIKSIPEFCEWCDLIGEKLINPNIDVNDIFKFISKPIRVSSIPSERKPISIIWNDEIYFKESEFLINGLSYMAYTIKLDYDDLGDSKRINFLISNSIITSKYSLILEDNKDSKGYKYSLISGAELLFTYGRNLDMTIEGFFFKYPPIIRFSDSSKMYNDIFFEFKYEFEAFDKNKILTENWSELKVSLNKESQYDKQGNIRFDSIQYAMITKLKMDVEYKIIFDDDDKNEAADIIAIKYFESNYSNLIIDLFHCKYSKRNTAGSRLEDLYEVCGQAQRSFHWKHKLGNLINHMTYRDDSRTIRMGISRFEKGGNEELLIFKNIVESGISKVQFNIFIVQPGVSKSQVSNEQLKLLGATELLLKNTGNNLSVITSN